MICMKDLSLFKGLSSLEKLAIPTLAVKKEYKKGSILFQEGEDQSALYLITSGKVKVSKIFKDGTLVTLRLAGPGEILGESALFSEKKHPTTATVVEDAFICACLKEDFERFICQHPEVGLKMIKTMGRKLSASTQWIGELAGRRKRGQLRMLLIRLAEKFGVDTGPEIKIDVKLTHQDLAEFLGASRVTVTNALHEIPGVKSKNKYLYITKKALEQWP